MAACDWHHPRQAYTMNSTQFNEFAIAKLNEVIAQTEFVTRLEQKVNAIAPESQYIKTPQRKAKLHDKQRIRRKDAKSWALRRSGCSDTAEIKKYLKILGKKLDLRLTSAWVAMRDWGKNSSTPNSLVNKEFADSIKQLKLAETFSIGDKVEWSRQVISGQRICPEKPGSGYRPIDAHICAWFPLVITAIIDGTQLDMWANPVPLDELVAV